LTANFSLIVIKHLFLKSTKRYFSEMLQHRRVTKRKMEKTNINLYQEKELLD